MLVTPATIPFVACSSRKIPYDSLKELRVILNNADRQGKHLYKYRCTECRHWHLTSQKPR